MPLPDDEPFNILFVQTVEKYKCLYDTSYPLYSSREEQEKAWNSLAELFSSTANECKVRWKNLRGGLTRYVRKRHECNGQIPKVAKQYYLWNDMHFVLPFLKSSRSQAEPFTLGFLDDCEEPVDVERFMADREISNVKVESSRYEPEAPEMSANDTLLPNCVESTRTGMKRAAADVLEVAVADFISRKSAADTQNPDLEFFRSLLPDVGCLSASQKRRFKIGVLQLLEDMSAESIGSHPSSVVSGYCSSLDNSHLAPPPRAKHDLSPVICDSLIAHSSTSTV